MYSCQARQVWEGGPNHTHLLEAGQLGGVEVPQDDGDDVVVVAGEEEPCEQADGLGGRVVEET